jgi:iron-sulfur cluster assembly protein
MSDLLIENDLMKLETDILGTDEQDVIMLTRNAIDQVNTIREENNVPVEYNLRLGTQSGGCSGMNYIIGFDSEINSNDKVFEIGDLNLTIDRKSLFYLQGVTLDFVNDVNGSGFIFNNPNNEKTCGCGGGGHHH